MGEPSHLQKQVIPLESGSQSKLELEVAKVFGSITSIVPYTVNGTLEGYWVGLNTGFRLQRVADEYADEPTRTRFTSPKERAPVLAAEICALEIAKDQQIPVTLYGRKGKLTGWNF